MASKMMRIAGRGSDGNAKAVKTDKEGTVEIAQRNGLTMEGSVSTIYDKGIEYISLERDTMKPLTSPDSTVKRENDHLALTAVHASSDAHASVITETKLNLTGTTNIYIDWEQTGRVSDGAQAEIGVVEHKKGGMDTVSKRFANLVIKNVFDRQTSILDVSHLDGDYYVWVRARDGYIDAKADSELKVYGISKGVAGHLETKDKDLLASVEKEISLNKITNLFQERSIPAQESIVITEDFYLGENVTGWSFYGVERNRPNILSTLEFVVEFTDEKGSYADSDTWFTNGGTNFRHTVEFSDVEESMKGLAVPFSYDMNGSSLAITDTPFNRPVGRYMRITAKNNSEQAEQRIVNPTIVLEGNF